MITIIVIGYTAAFIVAALRLASKGQNRDSRGRYSVGSSKPLKTHVVKSRTHVEWVGSGDNIKL